MSVIGSNILAGASGQGGDYTIARSLRFRSSASAYLNRTPASATDRRTWTFSAWVKRGVLNSTQRIFSYYPTTSPDNQTFIRFESNDTIGFYSHDSGVTQLNLLTTQVFRDPSAWYHIVGVFDTTQATSSNRVKLYVNGVQVTVFGTATYPSQNYQGWINNNAAHAIGSRQPANTGETFDGYMAEINFVDGQALTPSSFGANSTTTGVWQPKKYAGTYGTNGFYLPFTSNTQYFSGLFDGSTQTAYVNYNSVLNLGTTDYTVEAFVNPTSLSNGNGQQQVLGRWNGGANKRSYLLIVNNDGSVTWAVSTDGLSGTGSSIGISSSAGAVTTNTWTHIRISQTGGTVYLGINGTIVATATNAIFGNVFSTTDSVALGAALEADTSTLWTGRISNVRIVKGTALSTTTYTVPTAPLTAISGTSLLTLQSPTLGDNSGNSLTITNPNSNPLVSTVAPSQFGVVGYGKDFSGNNNTWTTNNLSYTVGSTYDSMTDVPTLTSATAANFAVLNPVDKNSATSITEANLKITATSGWCGVRATFSFPTSGKYYWEALCNARTGGAGVGILSTSAVITGDLGAAATGYIYNSGDGNKYNNGSASSYGATWGAGDLIGIAWDADTGSLSFYKNGTSQGTAYTGLTGAFSPAIGVYGSDAMTANFGQRPFAYTAPTGFVALNTFNLPTPTIGATASTQANKYMDATLYTGSSSSQTITNGSFQPDFIWTKSRSNAYGHVLVDAVRGGDKSLYSHATNAEDTTSGLVTFTSTGATLLGGIPGTNTSGATYVAWQWNAGGSTVTNTSGSISSQVRANQSAGFSVVTFTSQASGTATFGHGLGVAPKMVILKVRGGSSNWSVYNESIGNTRFLRLNTSDAQITDSSLWNNTSPTSSVVTLGSGFSGAGNWVAYCFSEVAGYSKFGSYTGNGSTDGTFVYTGFRPRYVMLKISNTAGDWITYDVARNTFNTTDRLLFPNTSGAEETSTSNLIDVLSNGFKLRGSSGGTNGSGNTYIYMAFAENPYKYSLAR